MIRTFVTIILSTLLLATLISAQPATVPSGCINIPVPSATNDLPQIVHDLSGFKAANVFTLVLQSTMVNNRSDAIIVLKEGVDACNYPSATSPWVKSYDGCTEIWTAQISWSVLTTQCGLTKVVNADSTVFDGQVTVTQSEALDDIRGTAVTRQLVTGLSFQISFSTGIGLNSSGSPLVFAPIGVLASVVLQNYNRTSGNGEISLFTSVQYPFMLSGESIAITSPGGSSIVPSIVSITEDCVAEQPCTKLYKFQLVPNGVCYLNGTYRLSFGFVCNPAFNAADCPVQAETGYIDISIISENLCGKFDESIDLQGQLLSYLDNTYATQRNSYLLAQTAYFEASVQSNKVDITSTSIASVSSSFDNQADIVLYASGAATTPGSNVNYGTDDNGSNPKIQRFHFNVSDSIFPVGVDASASSLIKTTLTVQYFNTAAGKRVVRNIEIPTSIAERQTIRSSNVRTSTAISVQRPKNGAQAPSSSTSSTTPTSNNNSNDANNNTVLYTVIAIAAAAVMCGIVAAGVAVFMYSKQKQRAANQQQFNNI